MSRRYPLIVSYHEFGYLLTNECWEGNNTTINTTPSNYLIHSIEWYFVGKIVNNKIERLSDQEYDKITSKGWKYQYNSKPLTHWKDIIYTNTHVNVDESNIKELVNEVRKRDPLILKKYISKSILSGKYGNIKNVNRKNIILTRDDYINIIKNNPIHTSFYPLCNDQKYSSNNFLNWIYYIDYQCWIDKMGDRCCCSTCYPIREDDTYSMLNLNNNHCVYCRCEDCICVNSKELGIIQEFENLKCNKCCVCKLVQKVK